MTHPICAIRFTNKENVTRGPKILGVRFDGDNPVPERVLVRFMSSRDGLTVSARLILCGPPADSRIPAHADEAECSISFDLSSLCRY